MPAVVSAVARPGEGGPGEGGPGEGGDGSTYGD